MFSLALKNILFYKSRSLTTFVLTFVSTLFFIIYVAIMDGSHKTMLEESLKVYIGAIEVYKKGYREIGGNEYLLENVKEIERKILLVEGVKSTTTRYETYGLLSYEEYTKASMLAGINPIKEKQHSELYSALIEGSYFTNESKNCIYMGVDLAKKLHTSLDKEVSFIGSASDNSFVADLFKVCGIFKTGAYAFDASSAFVSREYLDRLMYSQDRASYIHVNVENLSEAEAIATKIKERLKDKELEVVTWKTLMSAMVEMMQVDSIFGYISMSLFFVVIFFVIMIFGFINVSSRVKEFGTLRAIGLSSTNIRELLFYEIVILSLVAIALATPLGAFISYYYSIHPVIISGMSETYKEYGIVSDAMRFSFDLFTISWNASLIFVLNLLSIIYPIRFINAFEPVEAMHHV